jgi:hypothetical protein
VRIHGFVVWLVVRRPRCAVSSQAHLICLRYVGIVLTVNKLPTHDRDLRMHNQRAIYHHQENAAAYANALINLPMPMSFHKPSEKGLLCLSRLQHCEHAISLPPCDARGCRTMNYVHISWIGLYGSQGLLR